MIAIIPARGGSKGVPRKNIKPLAGFPLLFYSINAATQVFSDTYVSTEDPEIRYVARLFGAKVLQRPQEAASDTATDYDWLKHAFGVLKCDALAVLRPTSPTRCCRKLTDAVKQFEAHPDCTSLRSAHEAPETPYKWFEMGEDGFWRRNEMADLPRQALPRVFIPNGYIDITKKSTIEAGSAFGNKIISFVTEPIVEIDSQGEFDYLEYQMRYGGFR